MKDKRLLRWLGFAAALLALVWATSSTGTAQQPNGSWSPQQRIPGYDDLARTPYLISDQDRTVHAFNSVWIEDQKVIVYSQWTRDGGWTEPMDILVPPLKAETRIHGAFLAGDGLVHLVFFSGDETAANIYHARAPLVLAGGAPAWSKPAVIGKKAITPDEAALAGDSQGRLYVLYAAEPEPMRRGLYATDSGDGGTTWSEPEPVYLTYSDELWPSSLQVYVDSQDMVHAVWAVANISGNGETVYYANLRAGEAGWSEPTELAQAIENEVDNPSIVEYEAELYAIYNDSLPTTRWMRRSRDSGRTWTEPVRLFPHVGSNGPASLVIDSSNLLHMFFGNRVGSPAIHGLWHSVWQGTQWNLPQAVVSGNKSDDFDPSFANAVVSQGNDILVTWQSDPGSAKPGTWHSYNSLNAPRLPLRALPTVPVTPAVIRAETATPTATATPPAPTQAPEHRTTSISQGDAAVGIPDSPAASLLLGLVPVILLIAVTILIQQVHYYRRR